MSSATTARSPSPGPAARPFCGLRRSADSSPFRSTPDPPQRSPSVGKNGGGRASPRVSWAEKENDSHHEPRAKTPKAARHSTGGGGAAKSFMAPTISATSKAVAASASPRKRILGERNNDPLHLAPSSPGDHLAHAKPRGPPPTPPTDEPLGAPRRLRLSLDGAPAPPPPAAAAPVPSHGARFSLGGEAEEVVKPVCEVHRNEEPCHAAPYDPKTNYLSPRPQYLRYKLNPRVEQYRQNSGAKLLEDGFASSESSDDTTTQEEAISEEEQESQSALVPASDASADPVTPAAVRQLEPAPVSPLPRAPTPEPEEPAPTSPRARAPTPELEPADTPERAPVEKKKRKRSSLRFLLVAPLALVLFMAASFVCVPPPPGGSPVVLNASLSKVSDYLISVQELHPVELAAWLKEWSSSSLDLVTSYWNSLVSLQEPDFFGPHMAANLSAAAAEDADPGVGFYYTAAETRPLPIEQAPISSSIFVQELEIQEVVSAIDTAEVAEEVAALGDATVEDESTDGTEMVQKSFSEPITVIEKLNEFGDGLVVEDVPNAESVEEVSDNSGEGMASFSQDMDVPSQSEPEPEPIKDDMDVPSLQQDVQTDGAEGDQEEAREMDQEAHHGHKLGSDMWSGYLDKISKPAVAGSVLAVLFISAAIAFLHMRQNRARISLRTDEPTEQEPAEQVEQLENRSASAEQLENRFASAEQVEQIENRSDSGSSNAKASQLQDPVVEERIGVSGASQYSSSLSSGLGRRKKGKEEEDKDKEEQSLQTLEPMSRRESTGYSTSSYGSFTTYQKISAKKKKKDDEAMTPVRRSSRLRNQVKSPEASS